MTYGGVTHSSDSTWVALGLVLCAHLAAFAALRPQPQQILPLETVSVPLTVSLLNAPQTAPQKPKSPVEPMPKVEKPVKPKAIEGFQLKTG